jgi:hypothetical protein
LLFYASRINFLPRLCPKRAGTKALCWTFLADGARSYMLDLLMIAMGAGFFVIAVAYVSACDNL